MTEQKASEIKVLLAKNPHVRLYIDSDIDGVISGVLFKVYCEENNIKIHEIHAIRAGYYLQKRNDGVLDIFIDARARLYNEDVRIDHHQSGETKEYLGKQGIIVGDRSKYPSCVGLVNDIFYDSFFFNLVDKRIVAQADLSDSGKESDFTSLGKKGVTPQVFQKIFFDAACRFTKDDLADMTLFLVKLTAAFDVTIEREDVKKSHAAGMIVLEGYGAVAIVDKNNKSFACPANQWFGVVFGSLKKEVGYDSADRAVFILGGFKADGGAYIDENGKLIREPHAEPYQIFLSRNAGSDASSLRTHRIDIGRDIIPQLKREIILRFQHKYIDVIGQLQTAGYLVEKCGELAVNGGGGPSVGGLNFNDREVAEFAMRYLKEIYVEPLLHKNIS